MFNKHVVALEVVYNNFDNTYKLETGRWLAGQTTLLSLHGHVSNAFSHRQVNCFRFLDLSAFSATFGIFEHNNFIVFLVVSAYIHFLSSGLPHTFLFDTLRLYFTSSISLISCHERCRARLCTWPHSVQSVHYSSQFFQ